MSTGPDEDFSNIEFPLLTQKATEMGTSLKPTGITASSLLAASKIASSSANPYKTLSPPIDRIVGPFLRPGFGLQISGPPGTYVEQLLIGLVRSVTTEGKKVLVVDMQNKLKAATICQGLNNDERTENLHYHMIHKIDEVVALLTTLPAFLSQHPQLSLLVLSCLSFPFQIEADYSKRKAALNQVRDLIVKLCKQHQLVTVVTSTMAMQFVNPDGSRGTFSNNSSIGIMVPQIDLSCKSISSLIISRNDRKSGRAVLIPATGQPEMRAEFDYVGLELRDKAT